jgi:ubiquinone/menaquinone biosynthesis C-methylase UbiE
MNLALEAVIAINRLFPKPRIYGRESDEAYSRWEYEVGRDVFTKHFGAEVLQDAEMLDVGCGMGGKTVWYAEAGARHVTGIDIDPDHAGPAGRFVSDRSLAERVRIICGDAMRMPFPDGTFSVVTANDSMEHFADPAAALAELARVLRPGGHLYLYFTPWRSPLGSHLYDHVKIPWCNVVLPRSILYGTLHRSVLEEELARSGEAATELAQERYEEIIRYYENDINGITVRRFHEIVDAESQLQARSIEYVVPRFAFLHPLTAVPALREYFAGLVFADLQRS